MEETISLNEIFAVIKNRFKIIIGSTILVTLIAALISLFYLTPVYEATSQFIVSESKGKASDSLDSNTVRTNVEMINTYNVIITSPAILDDVIEELNLPYDAAALAGKITISSEQDSQVVNVTVADSYQKVATAITNEVVTTFQNEIPNIMDVDNVSVLTKAEVVENPKPVKPNVNLNIALGLVLGFMIGIGIAFFMEYLDTRIKTEKDIEKQIGVPVIGVISKIDSEDINKQKTDKENSSQSEKESNII